MTARRASAVSIGHTHLRRERVQDLRIRVGRRLPGPGPARRLLLLLALLLLAGLRSGRLPFLPPRRAGAAVVVAAVLCCHNRRCAAVPTSAKCSCYTACPLGDGSG